VLGSAAQADRVGLTSMSAMTPLSETTSSDTAGLATDSQPTETPAPTAPPTPTPDPTLQKGDENERVQALQNRLMDLGYLDLDESTMYYGSATKNAVSLFQRQHDLQQDGIAGEQTLAMIDSDDAKPYTLLQGTKGDDVDALQRQLERLGYLDKATGYYGTETIEAVKKFQERNDLEVDGKTGEHTLDVIYSPNAKASPDMEQAERRSANIKEMIEVAKAQLGKPYVWGAEGPKSFDCSGFVYYCLREAGSNRGRYNAKGYSEVEEWDKIDDVDDLEIGDLLFFWSSSRHKIGHVGIYIGDGKMIDASYSHDRIMIRDFNWSSYRFARRPW
jgi:cell wall-associated NlpC family hydrolase